MVQEIFRLCAPSNATMQSFEHFDKPRHNVSSQLSDMQRPRACLPPFESSFGLLSAKDNHLEDTKFSRQ